MTQAAFVYRAYDRAGRLLYVGMSFTASARIAAHRTQSAWAKNVYEYKVRTYECSQQAERVERRAIRLLKPMYNIVGNNQAVSGFRPARYVANRSPE